MNAVKNVAPVLVSKPLAQIVTFWRPGSQDWFWADEYTDLMGPRREGTDAVHERVKAEGFGFLDHIAPVLLGNDGRVWDGHHRICLAIKEAVPSLMVEIVELDKGMNA
jgi:hypothetical protein